MISLQFLYESPKPDLKPGEYAVPFKEKEKFLDLNIKSGRMKKFKRQRWLKTDIPPEKRTLKNLPRYANKKPKVRFQDWLELHDRKLHSGYDNTSFGWSPNGKCYGWSHRAIYGFKVGDEITSKVSGFDRIKKPFTIKTDKQCEEVAKKFARDIS